MTSYGFLRRAYSAAAFRIRAKARIARTDRISCFGLSIEVPPTVFHPGIYFSSKALGRYLRSIDLQGRKVLDMGCGAGIQSLIAASRGALVTGIDINPLAVESTRANAVRNGLADRVRVYEGDLFTPLENEEHRFDYIIFNPPFYPKRPANVSEHAWNAGADYETIRRFVKGCEAHLSTGGKVLMILSSDMDLSLVLEDLAEHSFACERVAAKKVPFEILSIYEARRAPAAVGMASQH